MSGEPVVGSEICPEEDRQPGSWAGEPAEASEVSQSDAQAGEPDDANGNGDAVHEPASPAARDPEQRVSDLEQELAALRVQHDTLNGQYMRLAADFDNFRKRQSREGEDQRLQITCATLSEILPVLDNFDRARQQLATCPKPRPPSRRRRPQSAPGR